MTVQPAPEPSWTERALRPLALALALAVAAALIAAAIAFVMAEDYADHVLPRLAIRGFETLAGAPLYPEGPARTFYGPLAYWAEAASLALFGFSLAGSKALGAAAGVAAFFVTAAHLARRFGPTAGMIGAGAAGAFLLAAVPVSVWSRPDPFLVLLAALGLWAARARDAGTRAWPPLLLGALAGLAANFKIHGALVFVPIALAAWPIGIRSLPWRAYALMAVGAAAFFLAPFASPDVSLANYLAGIAEQAGGRILDPGAAFAPKRYAAIYLIPLAAALAWAWNARPRRNVMSIFPVRPKPLSPAPQMAIGFFVAIAIALRAAAMPGSGAYQILPFLPVAIDLALRHWPARGRARATGLVVAGLAAVVLAVTAVPPQRHLWRDLAAARRQDAAGEVRAILGEARAAGVPVRMGYGARLETYRLSYLRPILVFAGHAQPIDAPTLMEWAASGIPRGPAVVAALGACDGWWLIPKGEAPFLLPSYYTGRPLFDAAEREAFLSRHRLLSSRRLYDVWACAGGAS